MEITEVNDVQELEQLRPAWHRLWRQMPEASFFQSCEWLEVAWRHTKIKQRLRVLVVGSREHPQGILPLVVRCEPPPAHGPVGGGTRSKNFAARSQLL